MLKRIGRWIGQRYFTHTGLRVHRIQAEKIRLGEETHRGGEVGGGEINCVESADCIFHGKGSMFHNNRCSW